MTADDVGGRADLAGRHADDDRARRDVLADEARGADERSLADVDARGDRGSRADDGSTRDEVRLATPHVALHVPPMTWGTQRRYTRDAVLLVLASHPYDAADYIRDYEEFLQERERAK